MELLDLVKDSLLRESQEISPYVILIGQVNLCHIKESIFQGVINMSYAIVDPDGGDLKTIHKTKKTAYRNAGKKYGVMDLGTSKIVKNPSSGKFVMGRSRGHPFVKGFRVNKPRRFFGR